MDTTVREKIVVLWTNGTVYGEIVFNNTSISNAFIQFSASQHNPVRQVVGYDIR